ncbi:MAG: MG2 domain-containing protein [Verrucomicrobiota bacterium]
MATGIQRFELPDEFNYIRILREIDDEGALGQLAGIFENRRQRVRAAQMWRESIERFGDSENQRKAKHLSQIVDPRGSFQPQEVQISGKKARLFYNYRNGKKVAFTARRIDIEKWIGALKTYLKSNPPRIDRVIRPDQIGQDIVLHNRKVLAKEDPITWSRDLEPGDQHLDRTLEVITPLEKAGAWIVEGTVDGQHTTRMVVWITNTAIASKRLDGPFPLYFVADATTGQPIKNLNVEFFGYRSEWVRRQDRKSGRSQNIFTRNFAEFTDEDGLIVPDGSGNKNYQWLAIARDKDSGRFGLYGFGSMRAGKMNDLPKRNLRAFVVTDRPVYRPSQTVEYKAWIREARYEADTVSKFAGKEVTVRLRAPRGEELATFNVKADAYGGISGNYLLGEEAELGAYRIDIVDWDAKKKKVRRRYGAGSFRVEEYKKPEFEVVVEAPDEPVTLGQTIDATIKANYYFGGPVTSAEVTYTVTRTPEENRWYPGRPWDWLYGNGYWFHRPRCVWIPGWENWGWWPGRFDHQPPEVVLQNTVPIGEDGTVRIAIDTAPARELFGDRDHRYAISVEVVDASRRTIVGNGSVIAARDPFKVYAWTNGGYHRAGAEIEARFQVRTADGKPVTGKGRARLYRVTYNETGEALENEIQAWDLETDDLGKAFLKMTAGAAGQYRIAYTLTDANGQSREGATLLTIIGQGFKGEDFRFDDLDLSLDREAYAPGDQVNLLVTTNHKDATVLLFVRPANGVYHEPEILRLDGKLAVHSIAVDRKDMPNFYVEALTVSNGRVFTLARNIVVPPEKRILTVEVDPSASEYKPGEKAKVKIRLKDSSGEPFVGSTVVAVYDKSIDYFASGTGSEDIKTFFWSQRRHHQPRTRHNLSMRFGAIEKEGEVGLRPIGILRPQGNYQRGRGEVYFSQIAGINTDAAPRPKSAMRSKAEPGAPVAMAGAVMADGEMADSTVAAGGESGGDVAVRSEFADTALWVASLETNASGETEVEIEMPENLTTWNIKTWALGHGTVVGQGETEVITRKDLLIRLQAPRFFTERDEVTLSAIVHNYLDATQQVRVALELEGETLVPISGDDRQITLQPNGEERINWVVSAAREGMAKVRMLAIAADDSDAMEMEFPVRVHGMVKTESWSGALAGNVAAQELTVTIPSERRPDQSRLEIRYSPSIALAMVDALPYLANYPHKTCESTLSRFVPAVLTEKIIRDMGVDLSEIRDKTANLNPQELGEANVRGAQWAGQGEDRPNPLFEEEAIARLTKQGLREITGMQNPDGGWGWFAGHRSYAWETARTVQSLLLARDAGVAIVPGVLERGLTWLENHQKEEVNKLTNAPSKTKPWKSQADNLDALVFNALVLGDKTNGRMRDFLYRDRTKLSPLSLALLGLAMDELGKETERDMILRNLNQYLVEDAENQTAHLRLDRGGYFWRWYGNEFETQAYFLKLLARTDARGSKARGLAKYLINNRKHATYWHATRDTAICLEALAEFVVASGENKPELTLEVLVNGAMKKKVSIDQKNLFSGDHRLVMEGDALTSGQHRIEFRKTGNSPLYFNAFLSYFTTEAFIEKAGLEVKVERKIYRLVREDHEIASANTKGQLTGRDYRVENHRREELTSGATVTSGDLIEVELVVESKNDYSHILLEDFKPCGFEAVALQSGYHWSGGLGAYRQFRDEKVTFLVRDLPRGKHSLTYRLRAEIPGTFSGLPATALGVYAPELVANSDEIKLTVRDQEGGF